MYLLARTIHGVAAQLRYRIITATLTRKPIVITKIREDDENPGLKGVVLMEGVMG